ncbi:MAG: hypothetical protein ACK48N_06000, partial [Planctomyces sp.]
ELVATTEEEFLDLGVRLIDDTAFRDRLIHRLKTADLAETVQLRQEAQDRLAELERRRRRQRQEIFDLEDEIEKKRQGLISQLRQHATKTSRIETIFVTRWEAR